MPQKKHKPEEIVAKLRQVDVLVSQGQSVAESARSIGRSAKTFHALRLKPDHSIGAGHDRPARLSQPCS
jgi:hypothetical protein